MKRVRVYDHAESCEAKDGFMGDRVAVSDLA
jgi:hypothetical protein